eukprot:scaffold2724_cov260-Pinguiococcus_pyrenoidosus.AAC.9
MWGMRLLIVRPLSTMSSQSTTCRPLSDSGSKLPIVTLPVAHPDKKTTREEEEEQEEQEAQEGYAACASLPCARHPCSQLIATAFPRVGVRSVLPRGLRTGSAGACVALRSQKIHGESQVPVDQRDRPQGRLEAIEEGIAALEQTDQVEQFSGVLSLDVSGQAIEAITDEAGGEHDVVYEGLVLRRHRHVRQREAKVLLHHHGVYSLAPPAPGQRQSL